MKSNTYNSSIAPAASGSNPSGRFLFIIFCPAQVNSAQIGINQVNVVQARIGQVGAAQINLGKVGVTQVSL